MITRSFLLLSTLTLLPVCAQKASAVSVFQGKATTGEEVYLETSSIDSTNQSAVKFEYSIGKPGKKFDRVKASANCYNGVISPQNPGDFPAFQPNETGATRKMYNAVCRVRGEKLGMDNDRAASERRYEEGKPQKLSDLTLKQEVALEVLDTFLAKSHNRYLLIPQSMKVSLINKLCSSLREGISVRSLAKIVQDASPLMDWKVYSTMSLTSAIDGGWCGEYKGELEDFLSPANK